MSKKIVIENLTNCQDCPFFYFLSLDTFPDANCIKAGRTFEIKDGEKSIDFLARLNNIPSWCPLPDDETKN